MFQLLTTVACLSLLGLATITMGIKHKGRLLFVNYTFLARFHTLLALLTLTKGFVLAVTVYLLFHTAFSVLACKINSILLWRPPTADTAAQTAPVYEQPTPVNPQLRSWAAEDADQAWEQRLAKYREDSATTRPGCLPDGDTKVPKASLLQTGLAIERSHGVAADSMA